MKEWKNVIFLVIFYGSCFSNNIIVRKIQAVVNKVMNLGLHKMWKISLLAEELSVLKKELP